ncbi:MULTISPECIES: RQC-minor-1 family DNA-binding protein [unclassified Thioalkalivibrio]|uniref:RQC-minor-1 family DNA-binding protein n=1 Tax=unclassified Thioalkalivibrio TaxID=2621013 RepID=UPI00037F85B8|nr:MULTISPECIES: RQC-minor-1 family DNA-binding protein [unclassified Thioalkalivibrio]
MSRSRQRVSLQLRPCPDDLSDEEMRAILRAADDLIMFGGRNLLAKVLKGSRAKKVLELGLNDNPVHGFYRALSEEAILARIDRAIVDGWLAIEYDGRLPLLVFTDHGWAIEREARARELFDQLAENARRDPPFEVETLRDRNRSMIWRLLDLIEASRDSDFIPLLLAWGEIDYRKVRQRIRSVIAQLQTVKTAESE